MLTPDTRFSGMRILASWLGILILATGLGCQATSETNALAPGVAQVVSLDDRQWVKEPINDSLCLRCHKDELSFPLPSEIDLVDSEGARISAHNIPESPSHESIRCIDCHQNHAVQEEPASETALQLCESCHHTGVFECNSCHT